MINLQEELNAKLDPRKILRHKTQKHRRLQKLITTSYIQYCNITGFLHSLPNFLLIGFPKCGTTSLYEYLIQHPNVIEPKGKEIDYFDRLYSRGKNWYRVSFPYNWQTKKSKKNLMLTGEATPRYIYHPHALNRIKKDLPKCKFIILLRNPIDRAYSHYKMNLTNDYEHRTFPDALDHEQERTKGRYKKMLKNPDYYSWDYDLYSYLELGIYVNHLRRWFSKFPKEQFLILQSENFSKHPAKIFKETQKFLDLPEHDLINYRRFKSGNSNESVDTKTREKLLNYFEPYNNELFELIGKKFNWNK